MSEKETALEVRPDSFLSVLDRALSNPQMTVDVIERMLAVQERLVADQRKTAFMAAMARLTPKLPEIGKHGTSHHGKYSRLEDIDRAIRPLIGEEGFSLSFDTQPMEGKIRVICKLSHAEGHSETKQIDLPLDNSGSKNGAQSVISTVSYGRRALTKMFFNLIEAGEDTDGNSDEAITGEQAKDIHTALTDMKSDEKDFLTLMVSGCTKVEDIPAREFDRVWNALEVKRRLQEEKRRQK